MPGRVPSLNPTQFRSRLQAFRRARVLVVGDLMLDEFVWGKVSRISPEAPVPVVWVQSESVMPGGAANVANNIRALGGQVRLVGVVGTDRWSEVLVEDLAKRRLDTSGVLRDPSRPTIIKTRVIAHHQQVVRVDREPMSPFSGALVNRLVSMVRGQLDKVDAVVIEDYGKGVISRELLRQVIPLARAQRKLITVDPKIDHLDLYQQVTALTPNRAEAGEAVGRELDTEQDVIRAGTELLHKLRCEGLLLTLGEDGMCLFEQGGRRTRIPTVAQEVFDVAGAGDTVVATFTLALASGASMPEAAVIANHAAGIVVGKVGVATTTPDELLARLNQKPRTFRVQGSGFKVKPSNLQPRT
ncbi:MAG: D-glycero-beta-D-manno-heptose-7-phosphate kinase [Candidatus Omnitrophica bacterium]|nr:D-glycero-beta-D-manno-heptose-7-phosphate kinase [Candidatus Omnitrophota bacterium]